MRSPLTLLVAFLVCFTAARLGAAATVPHLDWYATLSKPAFTPPNWAFGVAWTILYALMAVALWRVIRASGGRIASNRALVPFVAQLALNVGWSFAFFGTQNPSTGFVVICLLIPTIVWTIKSFRLRDKVAAWMLAPYLVWVAYAAILNAAIWRLNA